MAKEFKDFTFMGKKLSDLSVKYVSVDFDGDADVNMAMDRDMETGDSNRYKVEPNYFYDKWNDTLEFELDIIKDPCKFTNQNAAVITKSERREITRWLTSSHFPEWLTFSGTGDSADDNTLANFKLVDAYGNETYHTVFYRTDSKVYYIIENGLMRMSVSKDLKVYLDCQKLTINDELGRMVTYDKLGMENMSKLLLFYLTKLVRLMLRVRTCILSLHKIWLNIFSVYLYSTFCI